MDVQEAIHEYHSTLQKIGESRLELLNQEMKAWFKLLGFLNKDRHEYIPGNRIYDEQY